MIKSASLEQKLANRCFSQISPSYGLVVGGTCKVEECIFLLLSSKEIDETDSKVIKSVSEIDTNRLHIQCTKIVRMLPAGVHLSGLYVSEELLSSSNSLPIIKKLLTILRDSEKENAPSLVSSSSEVEHFDKLLLQIDSKTRKVSGKAVGFGPGKDFFRPVDIKIKSTLERWKAIKTHITLSIETRIPSERQREKILQKLKDAAEPYLRAIKDETRLLVNNTMRSSEDLIFAPLSQNSSLKHKDNPRGSGNQGRNRPSRRHTVPKNSLLGSKVDESTSSLWDSLEFSLFGSEFPSWHRTSSCSSIDSGTSYEAFSAETTNCGSDDVSEQSLVMHGRIPGIAFLPLEGTSVNDVLEAFRKDLIRSILLRLELLSEELNVTSGEMEVPRIQLPQRVLIRIPACPMIPLSDYKFVSETPDDVVRRVTMFFRPLGSPISGNLPDGDQSDSGLEGFSKCHSRQDSGAELSSDSELKVASIVEIEPVFNASCLDTNLERAIDGVSVEDELSDVEIIEDINEMAQSVSKSKNVILLTAGALVALIFGFILAVCFELIAM